MFQPLWANEFLRAASRYLGRPPSLENAWYVLIALGIILAMWGILYVWDELRKRTVPKVEPARDLFGELCQVHHLGATQRQFLQQAVQDLAPERWALAFIDRRYLERRAAADPAHADEYTALRTRLFGEW